LIQINTARYRWLRDGAQSAHFDVPQQRITLHPHKIATGV
jgi:hypothetical protein